MTASYIDMPLLSVEDSSLYYYFLSSLSNVRTAGAFAFPLPAPNFRKMDLLAPDKKGGTYRSVFITDHHTYVRINKTTVLAWPTDFRRSHT